MLMCWMLTSLNSVRSYHFQLSASSLRFRSFWIHLLLSGNRFRLSWSDQIRSLHKFLLLFLWLTSQSSLWHCHPSWMLHSSYLDLSCMSVSSVLDSYPLMLLHSLRNFLEWKWSYSILHSSILPLLSCHLQNENPVILNLLDSLPDHLLLVMFFPRNLPSYRDWLPLLVIDLHLRMDPT